MLMTSEDSAQNSVQPMMRPEWLSMMAFSIPSVCCKVRARGSAEAGRRDTLKEYPRLMASSSVSTSFQQVLEDVGLSGKNVTNEMDKSVERINAKLKRYTR